MTEFLGRNIANSFIYKLLYVYIPQKPCTELHTRRYCHIRTFFLSRTEVNILVNAMIDMKGQIYRLCIK